MNVIYLSELDNHEDCYFHFSNRDHMIDNEKGPGIPKVGISNEPRQRTNAYSGDEFYPCIYFSKGFCGILQLIDVWLRVDYDYLAKKKGLVSGRFYVDEELMKCEYDAMIKMLENAVYLKLDLIKGDDKHTCDFNNTKEDFRKRDILNHKQLTDSDKDLIWNYGVNSDFTTARMDKWNMSTHLVNFKHNIPPERITLLLADNGRDDALSILIDIYFNYKEIAGSIGSLDKFIKYIIDKKDKLYLLEKK
jgi:hypothetical protein